jgi:hypothetical protein
MKKLLLLLFIVCCSEQLFGAYTIEFVNKRNNFVDVTVRQKCFPAQDFTFTLWPRGTIIGTDFSRKRTKVGEDPFYPSCGNWNAEYTYYAPRIDANGTTVKGEKLQSGTIPNSKKTETHFTDTGIGQ